MLGSLEDEYHFQHSIMKSKLCNRLNEHLPITVGMYLQTSFTLNFFLYDAIFYEFLKVKTKKSKAYHEFSTHIPFSTIT